ncbi:MAG: hypothetical protein ACYCSO_05485 [Cuniculiplasma sp.]
MWISPKDADLTVLQYPTGKDVSVFSTVNIRIGEFVVMVSNVFVFIAFRRFLNALKKRRNE